jgi:hypothetical protein
VVDSRRSILFSRLRMRSSLRLRYACCAARFCSFRLSWAAERVDGESEVMLWLLERRRSPSRG